MSKKLNTLTRIVHRVARLARVVSGIGIWKGHKFKLLGGLMLASALAMGSQSFALNINSANQDMLESVKGVGPSKAKSIITEREKNGAYKDADDLSRRVRGIGDKTVSKMKDAGLTFEGADPKSQKEAREVRPRRTPARTAVSVGKDDDVLNTSKKKPSSRSKAQE